MRGPVCQLVPPAFPSQCLLEVSVEAHRLLNHLTAQASPCHKVVVELIVVNRSSDLDAEIRVRVTRCAPQGGQAPWRAETDLEKGFGRTSIGIDQTQRLQRRDEGGLVPRGNAPALQKTRVNLRGNILATHALEKFVQCLERDIRRVRAQVSVGMTLMLDHREKASSAVRSTYFCMNFRLETV